MSDLQEGKYIAFHRLERKEGRKTDTYYVLAKDGDHMLGSIRWWERWRKYCFFHSGDTVFEETCLREIAEFITLRTRALRLRTSEERLDEKKS